jgi:integrase
VGGRDALGLNGLRCGELIACNVEDLGNHSWHHALKLTTTKGDRPTVVALAPPTMQAVALAIDGRDRGPLLVNQAGRRRTPTTCRTSSARSLVTPRSRCT